VRPPGAQALPQPTGGLVSVAVFDCAACALKRAGYQPTRSRIRAVVRAWQASGELPVTDFDWWDRLVRATPLGARVPRHVAVAHDPRKHDWARS
jgi:hypothetical protein